MAYRAQSQDDGYQVDEQVSRPSRYRSLRKPESTTPSSADTYIHTPSEVGATDQQHEGAPTNSISRSMSRYRRRAPSVVAGGGNPTKTSQLGSGNTVPPLPAMPLPLNTTNLPKLVDTPTSPSTKDDAVVKPLSERPLGRTETAQNIPGQPHDHFDNPSGIICNNNNKNNHHHHHHDQVVAAGKNPQHMPSTDQRTMACEMERDRMLKEQKKKDLQRLEEQLANSQKVTKGPQKVKSPVLEKFVSLARLGKGKESTSTPPSPTTSLGRANTQRVGSETVKKPSGHIEPGGKGIVPQTDAPTSAINSGDRNVTVRCRHHTLSLPVTPETTPKDIILQTSTRMATDPAMSIENCIVLEQYSVLGFERRVRRYERIRDIMNSWERDTQNQLLVEVVAPGTNKDLDVDSVPAGHEGPPGCQLYMYQSNRPGKWNKRWITLLETGQVLCAKKPNAKTADKDTASLCHLSDYDLYTPTESQIKKHIKPPKRFCYAIKSQHKTTLFLNTEKYVQYFSTDDPQVAQEFTEKVYAWRSWYLVDRRPEARNTSANPVAANGTPKKSGTMTSHGGSTRLVDQIEPLVDLGHPVERLRSSGTDRGPVEEENSPRSPIQSTVESIGRRLSKRTPPSTRAPSGQKRESDEGFTGGLLGEGYEARKQALSDQDTKVPQNLAFTAGPSLLNSQNNSESPATRVEPASWFPSALEHTAKQRAVPPAPTSRPSSARIPSHERRSSLTPSMRRPPAHGPSALRPSTQHTPKPHTRPSGSGPISPLHADRRTPTRPLVDLTPKIKEPPQWSKEKKGHGVKPPDGFGHLVDFITVNEADGKSNNYLEVPPRNASSRPSRTKSLAPSSGRSALAGAPPVLPMSPQMGATNQNEMRRLAGVQNPGRENHPGRREMGRDEDRGQPRARHRERDREHRERPAAYNGVPGRAGTLRVV
ncbi:hypothetical protein GGS20DRAFT_172801 [Poronia punctata]|nr:hypothetical protein GGS20DRAFT_172801 [Poronia punctata]